MARSSKKKIERIDYYKYDKRCDEFREETVMSLAGSEEGLSDIIKRMTRRKARLVLSCVGTFYLDDGEISVKVTPTLYDYNTCLHAGVYKLNIDASFKDGTGVVTNKYGSEWSAKEPETVFEAADNLIDKVTETAWSYYNDFVKQLDEK